MDAHCSIARFARAEPFLLVHRRSLPRTISLTSHLVAGHWAPLFVGPFEDAGIGIVTREARRFARLGLLYSSTDLGFTLHFSAVTIHSICDVTDSTPSWWFTTM